MLSPAQVAPFLQNRDELVRKLAGQYFSQAHDPSPASAEDVWRMIDRYGAGGEHSANYSLLSQLPHTESSLDRTLKELSTEKDENRKNHLEESLVELPYGLFLRFRDRIEGASGLSDDFRAHLAKRVELAGVPPQDLWDQLMKMGQEFSANTNETEGFDPRPPMQLIEALARSPESAQWAISILGDDSIEDLRRVFAVEMLGRLRFPAADLLADQLLWDTENDFLLESATDALIRIGGTSVVNAISRRWKDMEWGIKLFGCDVLSGVKLKEAETALTEFLSQETDQPLRTKIAIALCDSAANDPRALEKLREMVSAQKWDMTMTDLDAEVVALFTMVGNHIPELPQWRAQVTDPELMKKRRQKAYDQMIKAGGADISKAPIDWQADDLPWASSDDKVAAPALAPSKTIRREEAKVGRNDPCPCGSGKKYKKCCGK